jgi:hypothetical protein
MIAAIALVSSFVLYQTLSAFDFKNLLRCGRSGQCETDLLVFIIIVCAEPAIY